MRARNQPQRHARAPSALLRPNWAASKENVIELWLEYAKFVPRLLRESILHEDGCLNLVQYGDMDQAMSDNAFLGVAVLDISGFTRMTQDAGRSGPIGAGSLHHLLNAFFVKLMEYLEKYGGDVFKFAGDGIIVVFLPSESEKKSGNMKELVSTRAVQCIHNLVQEYGCVTISSSGEIASKEDSTEDEQTERSPRGIEHESKEPVLSWTPQMDVDDTTDSTVESRVGDSLHKLWLTFGVTKWLCRPELSHMKGSWVSLNSVTESSQEANGVFGGWRRYKDKIKLSLFRNGLWRTKAAVKRMLLGKKSKGNLHHHALTQVWSELRDPLGVNLQVNPTVWIKGMVSCGNVCLYRVNNKESKGSKQICELIMVDQVANSGPMHDVAMMDAIVKSGETVISKTIASYLQKSVTGMVLIDGAMRIDSIEPLSPNMQHARASVMIEKEKQILGSLDINQCIDMVNLLKSHVPNTVKSLESEAYYNSRDSTTVSSIFSSDSNMMVSLRTCSIMFLRFMNLHTMHDNDSMQEVFETVQWHLKESGGDFLQMRTDEKGIILIAGHGLPRCYSVTRGNLGTLSVNCSLRIISTLAKRGYRVVVGVTTGRVLFASVGSDTRCEYTVYGDAINLAARLMMHATDGERKCSLVCDQETQAMCSISSHLKFVQIQDVHIKGYERTLPVFTHEPCHDGDHSFFGLDNLSVFLEGNTPFHAFLRRVDSIFVARENEVASLIGFAQHVQKDGIGSLVSVQGIAATGKTRLLKNVFLTEEHEELHGFRKVYFSPKQCDKEQLHGFDLLLRVVYGASLHPGKMMHQGLAKRLEEHFYQIFEIPNDKKISECFQYLTQDYMETHEAADFDLSSDSSHVLARALLMLVSRYSELHGQCIIILDGLENGHACIWRFARLFHDSKVPKVLLVLSYRWAQVVFENLLKEREYQYQLTENEPDLIEVFKKVGMSSYFGMMPVSSIRDQYMQDVCTIVLDPETEIMFLGEFTVENTKAFVTSTFPSISLHDGVSQLLYDALGGHVLGIKFACIFLYLYHQKKWEQHQPSPVSLGVVLIHQVRTFTPLWSTSETRFDSLPMYFKFVAVAMSIIGNVVPEDILYQLCAGLKKETVAKCLSTLTYMKYVHHKVDRHGYSYYVWQHPILSLSILDMLAPGFRMEMRARLALVLEHYEFRNGLDFRTIAWLWRDSCRLSETVHWRRCLRAIAAYEDQACVDIENNDFEKAQECLGASISIAVSLIHHQVKGRGIYVVPAWRIAGWERCSAACECLKVDADFEKASQHCMRALALLGEFAHSPSTRRVTSMRMYSRIRSLRSTKKKSIRSLASLGNPLTVTQYEGPDPNEPIKEIEGLTTFFLPKRGRTNDDEKEIERTTILETILYIFESSGPWDKQSLQFLSERCQSGMATATIRKSVVRLHGIQEKLKNLEKNTASSPPPLLQLKNIYSLGNSGQNSSPY